MTTGMLGLLLSLLQTSQLQSSVSQGQSVQGMATDDDWSLVIYSSIEANDGADTWENHANLNPITTFIDECTAGLISQ